MGVNEAIALMVAVDPSTTATIDGTTLRCAIPCAALHDVLMGTQKKPPGLDDSLRHNQFEMLVLEPKWLSLRVDMHRTKILFILGGRFRFSR